MIRAAFLPCLLACAPALAAVGCDLNNPDRDVARLFPGSTGYRAVTVEIQKLGGDPLLARVEARLRDQLRGLYESIDMPYTIYLVYKNQDLIGYIHGVNQKGRFGGIQIFLMLGLDLRIRSLYLQKMTGAYAGQFRSAGFEGQFTGLTLQDFDRYDVASTLATGKVAALRNPDPEAQYDFHRTLRGVKKNLVLVREFLAIAPDLAALPKAPSGGGR